MNFDIDLGILIWHPGNIGNLLRSILCDPGHIGSLTGGSSKYWKSAWNDSPRSWNIENLPGTAFKDFET